MAALTGKVPGNGTGTLSYTIPAAGLDVESVYAAIDTTGAAGAVTAELTIADQSGAVIARKVQNTTIDQGVAGSATWALQLLDDCLGGTAAQGFAATVATIAPAGTLRGYWRLGNLASPFLDSSGYVNGPSPMTQQGGGTAYTTHVPGALTGAQDDGALQFNQPSTGGYWIWDASGPLTPSLNGAFTIAAWVNPFPSASSWTGGAFASSSVIAGSPSYNEGWFLGAFWSGTAVTGVFYRTIGGVDINCSVPLSTNFWSFMVGTYDGSNLRLYTNGGNLRTAADSRADTATNYGTPRIGSVNRLPGPNDYLFYGAVDEVALWSTVLNGTQIATLYASAFL